MSEKPLISVTDLSVHFGIRGGGFGKKPVVRAVEGV
ncbi:MAG TPA: peptide ABC transporter ATP-binding protein, partial [Devosia sp.]|nr:peptide ABC transporter ATP-binding protein [Devosia sp.]